MKKIILGTFFWVLYQGNLFALEPKTPQLALIWSEGSTFYPFLIEKETKALLSKKCAESKSGCDALRAVKKKLKMDFSEEELKGGKNPSSLLCTKGFKGEVLILKDSSGRENSFCRFQDNSIVSANDLR